MKTGAKVVLLLTAALAARPAFAKPSKAARDAQTLDRYVTQLQQEPGNEAVLKKLFHLVRAMKPKPKMTYDAAETAKGADDDLKSAKTKESYAYAARSCQRALLQSPWSSPLYEKLSRAQESSGDPKGALASLKIYLLANPGDMKAQKRLASLKKASAKSAAAKTASASAAAGAVPKPAWAGARWSANEVFQPAQGPSANSFFLLQFSQTGGSVSATKDGQSSPFLRAKLTAAGASNWEYYAGDAFPGSCLSGWQPLSLEMDAQGTRISYRQPGFVMDHCEKDGGSVVTTLTR